jgi:hypothetical protein
VVVPIEK